MPNARRSGATAPNTNLDLEDVDFPDFKVRYLSGRKVCITNKKSGATKVWPLIPKPDNVGECKLEAAMHCRDGLDEAHDTYLNIRQAMRCNTAALTGSKLVLFSQLKDLDRHTIYTSVQSEHHYLFRFPGNWAGCEMLRRICRNKRDTIANKQDRKKGTRRGGRGGKRHRSPANDEGTGNNSADGEPLAQQELQGKEEPPVKEENLVEEEEPQVEVEEPLLKEEPLVEEEELPFKEDPLVDNSQDDMDFEDDEAEASDNYNPPSDEHASEPDSLEREDIRVSRSRAKARNCFITPGASKTSSAATPVSTTKPTTTACTLVAKKAAAASKSNTATTPTPTVKSPAPTLVAVKAPCISGTGKTPSATTAPILTAKPTAITPDPKPTSGKTTTRPTASKSSAARPTTTKVRTANGPNPTKLPRPSGNLRLADSLTPTLLNSLTSTTSSSKRQTQDSLASEPTPKEKKPRTERLSRADSPLPPTKAGNGRIQPVPKPEESALSVEDLSAAQVTAPPVTTRKAKAELVDNAETQIGKGAQAIQTR
ncbi:unnamed protein product, partial [Rhizoctonia solani]